MTVTSTRKPASELSPADYPVVNPYLTVKDVQALIDFAHDTFGGSLVRRIEQPDGSIEHAEIRIGDSVLMIGPPEVDSLITTGQHPRPGTFYVFVADVDQTYHKAMEHGANSFMLPTRTFYGDRVAAVVDQNDNVWWIAHREEALSQRQIQDRACHRWHCKREARVSD